MNDSSLNDLMEVTSQRAMTEPEKAAQAQQPGEKLYLDDLYVGQRFTSGTYLMEESRIKEFASEFDHFARCVRDGEQVD